MIQKILHLEQERFAFTTLEKLEKKFELTYLSTVVQSALYDHLVTHSYDAIFVKIGLAIDQKVMELQPNLKYIITPTTGLNHIDLVFAKKKGIKVISLKGETEILRQVRSTAEHTWLILLALIRNFYGAFEDVKNGYWRRNPFLAEELDGKILGIIGYGRLGQIVATYAVPFHMKVIATDIDDSVFENKDEHVKVVSLDELLAESDIISLHIPSNEDNYQFFNQKKIDKLKKEVVLINTSRGEIVDENALLKALQSKKIKGMATDVMDGDSTWGNKSPSHHPLVEYAQMNNNLIITPHMGGYGRVSIERTRNFITDKFLNTI